MNPTPEQLEAIRARFWAKVSVREDGQACWMWTGATTALGYGSFYVPWSKARVNSHRVAFMLATGDEIPRGSWVTMSCGNHSCCNPAHLRLMTPTQLARETYGDAPSRPGWNGGYRPDRIACSKGHPLDADNAYIWRGRQFCRKCRAARMRERARRRRAAGV